MNLGFNICAQFEHGALHNAGEHKGLRVRKRKGHHIDANGKEERAMQCTEVHFCLAIALCQAVEQDVGRMAKHARPRHDQCNADKGQQ
ncbi:unannotated protein [freshwater metagenome]|uniref:Unannotated protein n=1 Tax=freshwater metagenome TaxID=449393 RepID=A0A6J6NX71_9ZZZZ